MDQAHISVATFGPARVVRLFGVVDLAARARLEYVLSEQVGADGAGDVEVNMAAVRLLDASAVAVLVRVRDELAARDRRLRVTGARGLVLEALEITGAAKHLGAYDDATPTAPGRTYAWGPEITELLREVARLPADDPTRARLRQQAVESCLPYVERLARRFASLGESQSDLTQVAAVGLLKAVDGFNPDLATDFGAYALPTVLCELKRYFRDKGWGVRVPRRLQELRLEINACRDELTQKLGRSPTVADLAAHLGRPEDDVIEALVAASGYRPSSLDAPVREDDDGPAGDRLGVVDEAFGQVELRESLHPALAQLPAREQKIIALRFFGNLTQSEIAARLGISQMHVSRLLSRSLARLRTALQE